MVFLKNIFSNFYLLLIQSWNFKIKVTELPPDIHRFIYMHCMYNLLLLFFTWWSFIIGQCNPIGIGIEETQKNYPFWVLLNLRTMLLCQCKIFFSQSRIFFLLVGNGWIMQTFPPIPPHEKKIKLICSLMNYFCPNICFCHY